MTATSTEDQEDQSNKDKRETIMMQDDEPQTAQHAFQPPNNANIEPNTQEATPQHENITATQQRVQFNTSPQSSFRPIATPTPAPAPVKTKSVTFRDNPVDNQSQDSSTTPILQNISKKTDENVDDSGWSYYSNKEGTQLRPSTIVSSSIGAQKNPTLRSSMKRLNSQETLSSKLIRAPDIDDDLFEHEDIFDNSPYLDASKSYKGMQKSALNKMYGILAVNTTQQRIERGAFAAVILIVLIVTVILSLPDNISIIDKPGTSTVGVFGTIPPYLDWRLANWYAPEDSYKDVPFFWSVPMTGSLLFTDVMGSCLQLVQASEVGVLGNYGQGDVSCFFYLYILI